MGPQSGGTWGFMPFGHELECTERWGLRLTCLVGRDWGLALGATLSTPKGGGWGSDWAGRGASCRVDMECTEKWGLRLTSLVMRDGGVTYIRVDFRRDCGVA
jgi:hypothetical protein